MTNQTIPVTDIAVIKTVDNVKQLFSLRDQKIKKETLQNFGTGSGVKHQGDLYALNGIIQIVRMDTSKTNPSFSIIKNGDIQIDWGDGTREVNVFSHVYTDEITNHNIILYGYNDTLLEFYCNSSLISQLDISPNIGLIKLNCSENQLTSIDLSKNTELQELSVGNNPLARINISLNIKLKHFWCQHAQIETLDVITNIALDQIDCSYNPFTLNQEKLFAFATGLADRTGIELGRIYIQSDVLTPNLQSLCQSKNWLANMML